MIEETEGLNTIRRGIVFAAVFQVFLIILLDVGKLQAVLFISTIGPRGLPSSGPADCPHPAETRQGPPGSAGTATGKGEKMPAITVWATVSCQSNPGPGAYAFRVERADAPTVQAAFGRRCTNTNRMQLFAVIAALTQINRLHPGEDLDITVRSSSRYVTDNLHNAWHKAQQGETNADLWEKLDEALGDHRVDGEWVKTGSTPQLAELQQLAAQACGQPDLPPDVGYEQQEADSDSR